MSSGYLRLRIMKSQKPEAAIVDLNRVIRRDPTFYEAFRYRSFCHAEMGMGNLALDDLENAVRLRPQVVEARWAGIELAVNYGRYDAVLTDLDWLARIHPDCAWVIFFRGVTRCIDGKDMAAAAADINRAVEIEPREWCFQACRAVLQYRRTEYAKALGSMVRCGLALRRTEFKYWWNLEDEGDGHGRWVVGVSWNCEGADQKPDKAAKPADLDHKLVDMCLKALWPAWLNSVRVNWSSRKHHSLICARESFELEA